MTCFSHSTTPQVELGEKEQRLEDLQSKVAELKKCSQNQETPAKLQVLNTTLVYGGSEQTNISSSAADELVFLQ